MKKVQEPIDPIEFWTLLGVCGVLVILGGIFAGLTMGLLSLDATNMSILKVSGTAKEKKYVERIEPIRRNTHLLLVTLLLSNTMVNETLPVLFHTIQLDGYQAVLISTALIVLFGEIIPQAVCVRYGLQIGAFFAWPVRILIWILSPISYPIARLLDWILGHKNGVIYRRAELKELVSLHGEDKAGTLTKDEVSIVRAVLDIRDKTVQHVMTKMTDVFMLPLSSRLDMSTMETIMQRGHSRVPIYFDTPQNVIGVVLVKSLVIYDPNDAIPLSSVRIRRLPRVEAKTPLFEMLHVFEEGGSHMALVVKEASEDDPLLNQLPVTQSPLWASSKIEETPKRYVSLGIVTLEDVIEELLGEEIIDETDVYIDMNTKKEVKRQPVTYPKLFTALAQSPSLQGTTNKLCISVEDETTPLLPPIEIFRENSNLSVRQSRAKSSKKRRDKELIPAGKLATDVTMMGQSLRPSMLLSRITSRSDSFVSEQLDKQESKESQYVDIIEDDGGYTIDGQSQPKEWTLD